MNWRFWFSVIAALFSFTGPTHAETPAEDGLRLYHTHTGQHLDVTYRRGSAYVAEALSKLDVFLRDHRTGDVHHYDPRVFDLLSALTIATGRPDAVEQ